MHAVSIAFNAAGALRYANRDALDRVSFTVALSNNRVDVTIQSPSGVTKTSYSATMMSTAGGGSNQTRSSLVLTGSEAKALSMAYDAWTAGSLPVVGSMADLRSDRFTAAITPDLFNATGNPPRVGCRIVHPQQTVSLHAVRRAITL